MLEFLVLYSALLFGISGNTKPQKYEAKLPQEPVTETTAEKTPVKAATIITVVKNGAIFFKGEKIGTIDDTEDLEKEIRKIFEAKKKSNDKVAATVFVKAKRSLKYGDLNKLIEKLKALGAAPIGLQIDGLEN